VGKGAGTLPAGLHFPFEKQPEAFPEHIFGILIGIGFRGVCNHGDSFTRQGVKKVTFPAATPTEPFDNNPII
jgi:hypothetical protein